MARGKASDSAAAAAAPPLPAAVPPLPAAVPPLPGPTRLPRAFTAARWSFFCATVALAIGALALIDQRLMGLPFTYDGPNAKFAGRHVTIAWCLLSPSLAGESVDSRCGFSLAAAAVSLALSLVWSYVQVLRRNPFKHKRARLADLALAVLGCVWWAVVAALLCVWTDRANRGGVMRASWRNGLCCIAWAAWLAFVGLAATSALLVSAKSQGLFDKWAARSQAAKAAKAQERERAKAAKMQADAAAAEAAAAAAAAAARTPPGAGDDNPFRQGGADAA
ncbi:hypothetical protein HT031_001117 [Scenedesmus sp. PABB004]|nr:hypothetical protein HT031_001117 [Scenedesmus sp. PABB004]